MEADEMHEAAGIAIRKACIADARGILHVIVQGWKSAYRGIIDDGYLDSLDENDPERLLRLQQDIALGKISVADSGLEIIGIAIYGHSREKDFADCGEVYALYVLDKYNGCSLGTRLMDAAKCYFATEGFERYVIACLTDNPSCGFYEHIGGRKAFEKACPVGGEEYALTAFVFDIQ